MLDIRNFRRSQINSIELAVRVPSPSFSHQRSHGREGAQSKTEWRLKKTSRVTQPWWICATDKWAQQASAGFEKGEARALPRHSPKDFTTVWVQNRLSQSKEKERAYKEQEHFRESGALCSHSQSSSRGLSVWRRRSWRIFRSNTWCKLQTITHRSNTGCHAGIQSIGQCGSRLQQVWGRVGGSGGHVERCHLWAHWAWRWSVSRLPLVTPKGLRVLWCEGSVNGLCCTVCSSHSVVHLLFLAAIISSHVYTPGYTCSHIFTSVHDPPTSLRCWHFFLFISNPRISISFHVTCFLLFISFFHTCLFIYIVFMVVHLFSFMIFSFEMYFVSVLFPAFLFVFERQPSPPRSKNNHPKEGPKRRRRERRSTTLFKEGATTTTLLQRAFFLSWFRLNQFTLERELHRHTKGGGGRQHRTTGESSTPTREREKEAPPKRGGENSTAHKAKFNLIWFHLM